MIDRSCDRYFDQCGHCRTGTHSTGLLHSYSRVSQYSSSLFMRLHGVRHGQYFRLATVVYNHCGVHKALLSVA